MVPTELFLDFVYVQEMFPKCDFCVVSAFTCVISKVHPDKDKIDLETKH